MNSHRSSSPFNTPIFPKNKDILWHSYHPIRVQERVVLTQYHYLIPSHTQSGPIVSIMSALVASSFYPSPASVWGHMLPSIRSLYHLWPSPYFQSVFIYKTMICGRNHSSCFFFLSLWMGLKLGEVPRYHRCGPKQKQTRIFEWIPSRDQPYSCTIIVLIVSRAVACTEKQLWKGAGEIVWYVASLGSRYSPRESTWNDLLAHSQE